MDRLYFRFGTTFKCVHNYLKVGYSRHLTEGPFRKMLRRKMQHYSQTCCDENYTFKG
jgi:hypothetical protein